MALERDKAALCKESEGPRESESASKRRKSGADSQWAKDFPWLQVVDSANGDEMFCSLRRKHSRRPKRVAARRATWVDLQCKTLVRQSLKKHCESDSHRAAMEMECVLASSGKDGGIPMALEKVVSAERKALIGALKAMYLLNKREIAHTTNFMPLLDLGKSLGATYLNDMHIGGNASYTSERTMQLVRALGKNVSMEIYQQLQMSPFFSLCVDETTDVSVPNS